jgi:hypothetical protein
MRRLVLSALSITVGACSQASEPATEARPALLGPRVVRYPTPSHFREAGRYILNGRRVGDSCRYSLQARAQMELVVEADRDTCTYVMAYGVSTAPLPPPVPGGTELSATASASAP